MIITVVCDVLGVANNGTTIAAINLISSLKEKGHTVRVVCPDEDKCGLEGYYISPVFNFGVLNGYIKKNGVSLAKADREQLRQAITGADVVHIQAPFSLGRAAADIALELGVPITASFHAQAENITAHLFLKNFRALSRLVYRIFNKRLYRKVDAVHYPTAFIRDTFQSAVGPTNAYVISNGVRADFKRRPCERPDFLPKGKKVVVFTGRYSREKCHRVLIDAVSMCRHRGDVALVFAGAGPLEKSLRRYSAKRLDVMPVFRFFSRDEMVALLNNADLYVHPAEIEIEAISCLEAVSCGLVPVISDSDRSATRAFALDGLNLFRCGDARELADRIDFWLDNPELKRERSERYADYSRQFDFERCMDEMERMLLDAASGSDKASEAN